MVAVPLDAAAVLDRHPGVQLIVLLGSRARGDAHEASDWDIGFLGDEGVDQLALRADVVDGLRCDSVDLVPLARASAVARRDAAVHGVLLAEREAGAFEAFQVEAATFWADIEPVVREAHESVLRRAGTP
jgi:predicted nucleotidyltransferase